MDVNTMRDTDWFKIKRCKSCGQRDLIGPAGELCLFDNVRSPEVWPHGETWCFKCGDQNGLLSGWLPRGYLAVREQQ
jgi:hypothetical protein